MCAPLPQPEEHQTKELFANFPLRTLKGFLKLSPISPEPAFNRVGKLAWGLGGGGWCAGEGTPKFPGRLRVSGSARRGPVPSQPYPGFLSPATLPHRSFPATKQDPPTAKKLGVTSGASAVRQNCSTLALIPGNLGTTPASGAFLREAKGERSRGASSFVPADPRGPRGTSGSGGHPPGGAPRFPTGSADSARSLHPKRRARPQPGPLTDSADTQATKPKVSRIQARRIFPGARLLPATALQRGKNEVSRPAPPAQKDRGRAAAATAARARELGLRALASSCCACGCAPGTRRLLTCWFLHNRCLAVAPVRQLCGALLALLLLYSSADSFSVSRLRF